MNNKGFTLVEILAVIILLSIIIIIIAPNISNSSDKTKKKLLENKIYEIEKVAISYGQDNRDSFNNKCTINGQSYDCFEINVSDLTNNSYMNADDEEGNVINPYNDEQLNDCKIQIYKKYGKIYAVWKTKSGNVCWYE